MDAERLEKLYQIWVVELTNPRRRDPRPLRRIFDDEDELEDYCRDAYKKGWKINAWEM